MKLSGNEYAQVQQAILHAFDAAELANLVRITLDVELEHIITPQLNLAGQIQQLVAWAERHGKLNVLISAASNARPANVELKKLAVESGNRSKQDKKASVGANYRKAPIVWFVIVLIVSAVLITSGAWQYTQLFGSQSVPSSLASIVEVIAIKATRTPSPSVVTPSTSTPTATPTTTPEPRPTPTDYQNQPPFSSAPQMLAEFSPEKLAIAEIITTEIEAAVNQNLLTLESLYTRDAQVVDMRGTSDSSDDVIYRGWSEIRQRYMDFFSCCREIVGIYDLDIEIVDDRAVAVHHGTIAKFSDGTQYWSAHITVYELRRVNDTWMISELDFGHPLLD